MNLLGRLSAKPPIGHWGEYCFRYRGEVHFGKKSLVWQVAERFSRRFGVLTGKQADPIYKRLSSKYCDWPGSGAVFRSLAFDHKGRDYIAHPVDLGTQDRASRLADLMSAHQVESATNQAIGRYCLIGSAADPCRACGRPTQCQIVQDGIAKLVGQNRDGVCLHARCQALVALFPKAFNSRKYYQCPLIPILLEITKNANHDNPDKRRLAQHFVRHAGQVHQRAARRHQRQDGRQAGRQPAEIGGD